MDSENNAQSTGLMGGFNQLTNKQKAVIFKEISNNTGMPAYAVEKDWWVTQTLRILFDLEVGSHLVFKGGTSLSKGWKMIDRFSEDIDVALDRKFLKFSGDLSKSQTTKLRKTAHAYFVDTLFPELKQKFSDSNLTLVDLRVLNSGESDQDPSVLEIYYNSVIQSPGYIENRVQIEIGCRSLREPFSIRPIQALVDEYYPESEFAMEAFDVPVVHPERTFLEKIFLLHEELHRPAEKMRVNRLSRHLYDIFQLSTTDHAYNILIDKELYQSIVKHRHRFSRLGGVNYNSHQPQTVDPLPNKEIKAEWEKDYKIMQEQMIYGNGLTAYISMACL